jgi:hypothetical protein
MAPIEQRRMLALDRGHAILSITGRCGPLLALAVVLASRLASAARLTASRAGPSKNKKRQH